MNHNILTYLRIKEASPKPIFAHNHISIQSKMFQADMILYGPNQSEIFQHISKSILAKCIQGYNCSVFAYGQTGSGKTYTIQGTESDPGLVQRSLSFLHNNYDELRLSFIEVYNENMLDLYRPETSISIREDPVDGVTVDNLHIFTSRSLLESLEFYQKGIANRKTAATHMNENSSRSHSIFIIQLETRTKGISRRSKLCFVDLAGSERIGDNESERIRETCNINTSLLCLGKIVHKLSSNDRWHISYRDSKLTFLLKDSLGGNSKLAIIGTVNMDYPSDTINTLNFLNRSKMISNSPSINYDTSRSTTEELVENLRALDEENLLLRTELVHARAEKDDSVKTSLIYNVRKLRSDFKLLEENFYQICKTSQQLIDNYYDGNKRMICEISEYLRDIDETHKENIRDIQVKRRKVGDQ